MEYFLYFVDLSFSQQKLDCLVLNF